jgi:putative endonuclease
MSRPTSRSTDLGRWGEDRAAAHLEAGGHNILDRNYRFERAEIDLVCFEPTPDNKGGEIVFVEVKTRRGSDWGTPEESVTPAQKRNIMRAAEAFLYERKLDGSPTRFDVIAIERGPGDAFELRHHRHAFGYFF